MVVCAMQPTPYVYASPAWWTQKCQTTEGTEDTEKASWRESPTEEEQGDSLNEVVSLCFSVPSVVGLRFHELRFLGIADLSPRAGR
jgi:hypothetical protein